VKDLERFVRDLEAFILDYGENVPVANEFDALLHGFRGRLEGLLGNGNDSPIHSKKPGSNDSASGNAPTGATPVNSKVDSKV